MLPFCYYQKKQHELMHFFSPRNPSQPKRLAHHGQEGMGLVAQPELLLARTVLRLA
jgi:hypothetical protein